MDITEIRIKLMEDSEDRLRAFCSITIDDCFVVRDLKIIDGTNGPFVAMPSRKLTGNCQRCRHKNHLRANYCNNCGSKVGSEAGGAFDSPQKLYADVAHPINSVCREQIQNAVVKEFEAELARSHEPGYRSRYDDDFADAGPEGGPDDGPNEDTLSTTPKRSATKRSATKRSAPKPAAANSDALPKRPHFLERDDKKTTSANDEDQDFGAGVF